MGSPTAHLTQTGKCLPLVLECPTIQDDDTPNTLKRKEKLESAGSGGTGQSAVCPQRPVYEKGAQSDFADWVCHEQ